MARQQTLVQLNDELLHALDARAAREGASRSELIRRLLTDSLARDREVDRQIVEGYTRQPQDTVELVIADAASATMLTAAGPWPDPPRDPAGG